MKTHIIYNPSSNNYKSKKTLDVLLDCLEQHKVDFCVHTTQYKNHAKVLVKKLTSDKKDKQIICVGGDGTVHECLNGIRDFEHTYFAIIPAGSGNDYVTNFETYKSNNLLDIINKIIKNEHHYVDYYLVNNKIRAINCIGFGIDANILKCYSNLKFFSQKTKYKIATIYKSLFFKVHKCSYQIDNKPAINNNGLVLFIVNGGKQIGGGITIDPDTCVDDGKLSVSVINKFNRLVTIPTLIKLLKNSVVSLKTSQNFKCKKIKITMDTNLYECDGEIYEDTNKLVIKPISKKLKLIY